MNKQLLIPNLPFSSEVTRTIQKISVEITDDGNVEVIVGGCDQPWHPTRKIVAEMVTNTVKEIPFG